MHDPLAIARFWRKVDKTAGHGRNGDCWKFTGYLNESGYGRFWSGKKVVGAHRFAWEAHHNKSLCALYACHSCDNPSCVRPDHLFADSAKANTADAIRKNRFILVNPNEPKPLCGRGHAMVGDNVIPAKNGRSRKCKSCAQIRERKRSKVTDLHLASRIAKRLVDCNRAINFEVALGNIEFAIAATKGGEILY